MGYQVLLRMSYFLPERRNMDLLCVWMMDASQINTTTTAIQTFGTDCGGILVVTRDNITIDTLSQPKQVYVLRLNANDHINRVFHIISEMKEYSWFLWSDPRSLFGVPRNLARFMLGSPTDQAVAVQPWRMSSMLESDKQYHQLFAEKATLAPACEKSRAGNRQYAQLLSTCEAAVKRQPSIPELENWISACVENKEVMCQYPTPDRSERWKFLSRYFEIDLPENSSTVGAAQRIHHILRRTCNDHWNQCRGATDTKGVTGYIVDPTHVRAHSKPVDFTETCQVPMGKGEEGVYGIKGLQKIKISTSHQTTRLFCMVYTHSGAHDKLRAITDTWGRLCDGFVAASNLTDPSIGAINLLHEGPERYRNMWSKVRSMWRYVYEHYRHDYDLFHIGGDDHYIIPSNIRYMIGFENWNLTKPLFIGGSLPLNNKRRYCNGGSGYTLNAAALRLFIEDLFDKPSCMPHLQTSKEDMMVASCFRSVGIQCMDTNDFRNETRYHTWNVDQHTAWNKDKPAQKWKLLVNHHGIAWLEGLGQISETSTSFHLKNPDVNTTDMGMRRYHAILYGHCT